MTLHIPFDNTYGRLPERFYTRMPATPVAAPKLLKLNENLARQLGMDPAELASDEGVAALAGNAVPEGADPLAQAYAGHQFGGWSPQLGDGRALLLGEVVDQDGQRFDIQLKGSGPTPYSRMGDGRAWLGPVLREYIVSEAMHALGIPTTRALAAVTTGETVFREEPLPGAVFTRVASSHIRVGTFQFFAARGDREALELLLDHVLQRHYPDVSDALGLVAAVTERQARLIAQWMSVGFIHGVMNTDNAHIAGETIDYGPCAFMDDYHPGRVFSSIDHSGRYAFFRQPDMGIWNMAQLATALLPLMGEDEEQAIEEATKVVNGFTDHFHAAWTGCLRAKIGLAIERPEDAALASDLLNRMAEAKADFTNTFRGLSDLAADEPFLQSPSFADWKAAWYERLAQEETAEEERAERMSRVNPAVIPRNHRIEAAIQAAVKGNLAPFEALNDVLARPFDPKSEDILFRAPPLPEEVVQATFCGT